QPKPRTSCNLCAEGLGCVKQDKILTNEHSTLRWHAASLHLCQENKFESMLPDDTKERRQAVLDKNLKTLQSSVTDHFKPQNESERPIPYSDKAFMCAAIEWLIDGDLPLQVFSRPSFIGMGKFRSELRSEPEPTRTKPRFRVRVRVLTRTGPSVPFGVRPNPEI
ncbi:hypothetical protein EDB84DRAFT_1441871, partial [Lactarius hengduanensis]